MLAMFVSSLSINASTYQKISLD